jgi:Restriction endonuclease
MNRDINAEFRALWQSKHPRRRGHAFEDLFCRFLYKNGFDVQKNSRSARPRQTDLFAEHGENAFLFELKWLKRRVDIAAVGQIKDRLGRVPRGTIGCICSPSGFTESLIRDIEEHRHEFEVLLFNPLEIHSLFAGQITIFDLIDEKRRNMRRHGALWFYQEGPRVSSRRYVELPTSIEHLQSPEPLHFRLDSPHISDLVFARTPLIFDEYILAASLSVRLRDSTVDTIRDVLTAATNYLGLRGGGSFGIRQSRYGWYGLGSENFLKEIARYSDRYKVFEGRVHHSEELVFFEELTRGIFLLTARQSLTRKGHIHSGEITIRLPGIPVDTHPYLKYLRSFTRENAFFRSEDPLRRAWVRPFSVDVPLDSVVTEIRDTNPVRPGGATVSGIVIKNPFFTNPRAITKLAKHKDLLAFAEPEYLICTMDDWYDVGDEVDAYEITGLETVTIGEAVLLHPRCTWKRLTKRSASRNRSGLRKLQAEWEKQEDLVEQVKKASARQ